jgi:transposase
MLRFFGRALGLVAASIALWASAGFATEGPKLTTGCQWRQLPKDFPPKSTTHDYYVELLCSGTLTRIHHALYAEVRSLEGRAATPTLAIVDSQTVKSAEKGGQTLIRPVMMRARKSKAKSATPLWIRSVS